MGRGFWRPTDPVAVKMDPWVRRAREEQRAEASPLSSRVQQAASWALAPSAGHQA